MTKDIIILAIVLIIAIYVTFRMIKGKMIKKQYANYSTEFDSIKVLNEKVQKELVRTKQISKNEESKKLYDGWQEEYNDFNSKLEVYDKTLIRLGRVNRYTTRSEFYQEAELFDSELLAFKSDFESLYNKVKQYTNYELENTRISLSLKERIKELQGLFDAKLAVLDIYNFSFNNQIEFAQLQIEEFEDLQREGDYPEGRSVLKECGDEIDKTDYLLNALISYNDHLTRLNNYLNSAIRINGEIKELGFSLNLKDFDNKVDNFKAEQSALLDKTQCLSFDEPIDKPQLVALEKEITGLDERIIEFKGIVEEKYKYIEEIIVYHTENKDLLVTAADIIQGAIVERDNITSLYELTDLKQINKINIQISQYEGFKSDYEQLTEIIYQGKEDYARSKARIIQSNQYLIRLLSNLQEALKELYSIRQDEITARENIRNYHVNLVEIDLYLRKHDHLDKMSDQLANIMKDLNVKLGLLEQELEKDPLNITNVRNLNASVSKLLKQVSTTDAQENIKQREAAKHLMLFMNRYANTQDGNVYSRRFNTLFAEHDYRRILLETHDLLTSTNETNGKQIYKKLVSKVDVEPFTHIFLEQN